MQHRPWGQRGQAVAAHSKVTAKERQTDSWASRGNYSR
jgi:hypothetical protein